MLYSWNVIGHEKELKILEANIIGHNIYHAYLFVGPEKIGKSRIAKAFAGVLQCPNNFCHTCPSCIQIEKKCHPDTIELEDNAESIKISEIRDIVARLNMTGQSPYKILLIENIGRLTDEAGNALLKILEEPPPKTVFLFTASQLRDLMPTMISRMRTIYFKKPPDEIVNRALKEMHPEIEDEMLNQILLLSLGRSGQAIKLLTDPGVFQEFHDLYQQIQFLKEKASMATRLTAIQAISQDEKKTKIFLSLLVHYLRYTLLAAVSWDQKLHWLEILEEIDHAVQLMERNIHPRLLLENIMLHL